MVLGVKIFLAGIIIRTNLIKIVNKAATSNDV